MQDLTNHSLDEQWGAALPFLRLEHTKH